VYAGEPREGSNHISLASKPLSKAAALSS